MRCARQWCFVGLAVLVVTSAMLAAVATAKSSAVRCKTYTTAGIGYVDKFSDLKTSGVACQKADVVLSEWVLTPGIEPDGFKCHARRQAATSKKGASLKCTAGSERIAATWKHKSTPVR